MFLGLQKVRCLKSEFLEKIVSFDLYHPGWQSKTEFNSSDKGLCVSHIVLYNGGDSFLSAKGTTQW